MNIRRGIAGTVALACALAAAGYLMAVVVPPAHEFVAFVEAGSLEGDELVPKDQLLDRMNGLGAASEVARGLNVSPWAVWRGFTVSAEGQVYVVRVRDRDPQRGARLTDAVRGVLVRDFTQRYEAAMVPHRAYIASLENELERLRQEPAVPAAESRSGRATDRWLAGAEIRKHLRDAQMFAALSKPPVAVGEVQHRVRDLRGHRIRSTLTGAVIGVALSVAALVVLAFRAQSARAFVGA